MLTNNHFYIKEQYTNLADQIRLVILHPAAYSSHRVLGQVLLEKERAVYVHLPDTAATLEEALHPIWEALAEQLGLSNGNMSGSASEAGQRLAAAVNQQGPSQFLIEGYDGQAAAILNEVLASFVHHLEPGHRVILSGRALPSVLVEALQVDDLVAVLPVDQRRMLVDYTQREEGKTFLEVRAFGQGHVLVDGRPITRWEGQLPRALFFYFIDQAMVTRDQIFEVFWPDLGTREATNVFHVTKRKISEILGLHVTVYGSGFYRISPEIRLHYDVVNFQEAIQEAAIANDEEAEQLYQVAIDLYHDDFLSGMDDDWVKKRRDEMRKAYTDALVGLARIYERRNDQQAALGLFLRASASSPQREDLVRAIMELYDILGEPERAVETFQRLVDLLDKKLGVSPGRQTIELMEDIRSRAGLSS